MMFTSSIKNSNHDIDVLLMRFSTNKRKANDIVIFEDVLQNMCILHFPSLKENPEVKYSVFYELSLFFCMSMK